MLKASLAAAFLVFSFSTAFADIQHVDEAAIVKAVGAPVLKKISEEDSPGCMTTRYSFGDKVFAMKLEFKCNRINIAWIGSREPQYEARSKHAEALAKQAVAALTQGDGTEVQQVLDGSSYKGRTYSNGVGVSGSCAMNSCLLTFK